MVKVWYSTKGEDLKTLPDGEKNKGISAFFIKYYCLVSAAGFVDDPVFIIADDIMKEGILTFMK